MDAAVAAPLPKKLRINRFLPYWAVFQSDLRVTLNSWVYRLWVIISVLAATGYLLYVLGAEERAGMVQPASHLSSDLIRWGFLGSVALIIVLTGGSISAERGVVADSILSRGISRHQYFFGKWHARVLAVSGTFLIMALVTLGGGHFFLHQDLSFFGSIGAMAVVMALLAFVTTCGVTVSAMSNSTMVGIAVLWIGLCVLTFALGWLPHGYLTPDRVWTGLPNILQGKYDMLRFGRFIGYAAAASGITALIGTAYFSRRDV